MINRAAMHPQAMYSRNKSVGSGKTVDAHNRFPPSDRRAVGLRRGIAETMIRARIRTSKNGRI